MRRTAKTPGLVPDRRQFLALGAGLFLVGGASMLTGHRRKIVKRTAPVMGTVAEAVAVHSDPRYAQRALGAALRELQHVDRIMSRFRRDSDLGRANRLASHDWVEISEETAYVLEAGLRWAADSGGTFDPALGRVSELWSDGGHGSTPPPSSAFRRFEGADLHRQISIERRTTGPRVRFRVQDVALDFGGIAKGFAVDLAAARLRDRGIHDGLVSVGGDLYALGLRPNGEPWRVGVRDPNDPNGIAFTIEATDQAIATSGDYVRGFTHEGRRYHHILDPTTARPTNGPRRSLTVTAPSCLDADASATAAFGRSVADVDECLGRSGRMVTLVHAI